jgi:hypothetical protein
MSNANCELLNDLFTDESGRIAPEIQRRLTGKNPVIDLIEKGPWEDGMGEIVNVLTVERSFAQGVQDDTPWAPLAPQSTGDNAPCIPQVYQMSFGQTQRQMQLYTRAIESPDICLELLRPGFSLINQLDQTFQSLTQGLQWELEKQAMNQYIAQSGQLICFNSIGAANVPINTGTQGFDTAFPPNCQIDQGLLDWIYDQMDREVCGDGAMGMSEGANIYGLVLSSQNSRNLKTENAAIRDDLRYAFDGDKMESPLLEPYGMGGRCYGNFTHIINNKMPRYDFVPGVGYIRQSYWNISPAATKGNAPVVSQAYLNAEFEAIFVFNPMVYKWLIPGMLNAPGGDMAFTTPNYFPAQFQWRNILDRTCNPDGTIGFYRGRMAMAAMPLHPSYGWVILAQRPIAPIQYVSNGLST